MFVEVRPGEGGEDAALFATHLVTALTAFARRNEWSVESTRSADSRTAVLAIHGDREALARYAGTHRVQRVPENGKGRKHTSTATVAVLDVRPAQQVVLSDRDLRIDRMRGSGTGGQRRNKVETAVRVTHVPTGTVVTRLSGRSQAANIEDAKHELVRRLEERSVHESQTFTNSERDGQVNTERSGKDFTHCWYRDEVIRHSDGHRWTIRQWKQGRL